MKYKKSVIALLVLSMLGFSGCAENQIPDMTEEEMQAMGEFVAYTLTKYDVGHSSRLMDLPPEENKVPGATPPPAEPAEKTETEPVEDTTVTEAPGVEPEGATDYTAEEVMELPEGVILEYTGQEICDSYPGESEAFAVSATEGKKLLVLKFSITNTLEQEVRVDLLRNHIQDQCGRGTLQKGAYHDAAQRHGFLCGHSVCRRQRRGGSSDGSECGKGGGHRFGDGTDKK